MRIAVIADTHNRYPPGFLDLLAPADEIWHLGDVCAPRILEEIRALGHQVFVVRGNNDSDPWPQVLHLEREGQRFHLEHIAPRRPPPDTPFFLHGHTHVPRDEFFLGTRWLNPGAVSLAHRGAPPSFAWLHVVRNHVPEWTIVKL
ncbi:metallophosphoesterase family protein [Nibricoccus sp. IMCC34717]|uniref:metallophosphoesterase family protein n=1 Tax=Nibricoccus sp. IMCC34717 TaxID=3034021 RepID=UPI00384CB891